MGAWLAESIRQLPRWLMHKCANTHALTHTRIHFIFFFLFFFTSFPFFLALFHALSSKRAQPGGAAALPCKFVCMKMKAVAQICHSPSPLSPYPLPWALGRMHFISHMHKMYSVCGTRRASRQPFVRGTQTHTHTQI